MAPPGPPPGGKVPCKEPACQSRTSDFKAMMAATAPGKGAAAVVCPPDRDELGRHSWTLLHTIAAYYPDQPTPTEKQAAVQFLRAFPTLYPCKDCAEDMAHLMEAEPPRVDSRKDFSLWMCELHNHVNEQVGKAPFKCELKALDEAWRHASKACEEAQSKAAAAGASASRTAM